MIFIIDGYDRLTENSVRRNFYDKMKSYLQSMYGSVIKNNGNVEFSFLTGCTRISIESMSSGPNNVICYDINIIEYSKII